MIGLLLVAGLGLTAPQDAEYRAALEQLYDGSTATALARFGELCRAQPRDPVCPYLTALTLFWRVRQQAESSALDAELQGLVDRAVDLADARLATEPRDVRARLARGGALGVRGRLHILRGEARPAARAAVRMREELLRGVTLAPGQKDALFGLGLYDYYTDVLPHAAKLLRLLAGLPGGDRERGMAEIESAKEGSSFHGTEVRAQLYQIYAFYEGRPDRAHAEILDLRRRYPGAPLWGLQLAEHERQRLGLYASSAEVAREVLAACRDGRPNYAPVVATMARLALGEALLDDLRFAEARDVLSAPGGREREPAGLAERIHLALGQALELTGDRGRALPHYRIALASADRATHDRARAALARPLPPAEVRSLRRLAEARRLREAGAAAEATRAYREALAAWPASLEARLRVAEDDLAQRRLAPAREALGGLEDQEDPQPPWIKPWARLLRARLLDLAGRRAEARPLYQKVLSEPWGQGELRSLAALGLERPYLPQAGAAPDLPASEHSK